MKRNRHNIKVRRVVAGYRSQGYRVRADVSGYPRPRNYGRKRSDMVARKGRDKVMVEIETQKSMYRDIKQRQALRKQARKNNMRFRTIKMR